MPVVVIGAGGHARPVIEALRAMGETVAGLLDDGEAAAAVLDCPLLGGIAMLGHLQEQGIHQAVVAIGHNATRERLGALCREAGLTLPRVIHPAAILSPSAVLADGAQVMARAVIGPEARLGAMVLVNTGAIVEHECHLADAVHLGPGAVLCGAVKVGTRSLIGAGAVVHPGIDIGADAVVAPGAAVSAAVLPATRVGGVPARHLR